MFCMPELARILKQQSYPNGAPCLTTKLSKTWIGLILILNASDHSAVTLMGYKWWATCGQRVVLGFIVDFKICMQDFIKCLGTYIGRTCSHQRLEHHLTSSTPDRLSGTDGLFKMGVNKVTITKHKNKFMWSIKHQLTRSKCLPKLYSLAFHLHHYSPHCHSNDMLILLIY